ncbi:MAG TPA: OmpA family protein [Bacteroidales bacterium]|nr:OmpA family protein [Bacteroidales bacterium]HPF01739.1 OmpA family protein [Bacteroidales bacterium]HPJ59741.1 OmpA family protein [Bacteroidales bacterium]HPR11781.1 OmpA family protein [Bacteroidales bacterium]HRW84070.1 OmpA family protein [Bacteroidales bacterium]
MRILIAGFVAFVIWCFVSAWLYNDKLLPVLKKPVTMQAIPENQTSEADSLMKLRAMMPEDLTVGFEFNSVTFNPDQKTDNSIAEFKAWLEKFPGSRLAVTGYTDIVGTTEYNYALGLKRAESVGSYLESKGIPPGRLIKISEGESKAAENYITPEGRAKSRKTVVSIKLQ